MSENAAESAPESELPALSGGRGRLGRVFKDVATSAPVIFSAGNLIWSLVTADPYVGIGMNVGVLVAATGFQIRDSLLGIPSGLSFFITAGVHAASAISTLINGADHIGIREMFNVLGNHEARRYVFTAAGRTGWAFAHYIMGYRQKHGHDPKHIGSQPIHAGYADIFMTAADTARAINPTALGLVSAGLAKAFLDRKKPAGEEPTVRNFLLKHITPNRLYASTFLIGAVQALSEPAHAAVALSRPFYAAAEALWGYGYTLLDGERNHELLADVKKLMGKTSTPAERPSPPA